MGSNVAESFLSKYVLRLMPDCCEDKAAHYGTNDPSRSITWLQMALERLVNFKGPFLMLPSKSRQLARTQVIGSPS
jgi:hypothetical protein